MQETGIDIIDEIRSLNKAFGASFSKGDTAAITTLYTEDAMLLPDGSDILRGKEAIQQFWQSALDMGAKVCKLDTVEVEELEQTAIELGHFTMKDESDQTLEEGKYMVVWKKENEDWKIQKDIWNSNQQP